MRIFFLTPFAIAALVLSSPALARPSAGPCTEGTLATTASYRMALDIGHQEDMYLPSEVKARHLKDGEIMLGGEMSMIGNVPKGSRIYHLEVHICNKAGVVVTKLKPAIIVNTSTMLPAAIMVGIGAPHSDYHYGNDIVLKPGSKIAVHVTVKGEVAVFHATVPKS